MGKRKGQQYNGGLGKGLQYYEGWRKGTTGLLRLVDGVYNKEGDYRTLEAGLQYCTMEAGGRGSSVLWRLGERVFSIMEAGERRLLHYKCDVLETD